LEVIFVTGTGTGIGKTVLTALLARRLVERGINVAALKPLESGGRADARLLWKAAGRRVPLDAVNPWWFEAAVAPELAARKEGRVIRAAAVIRHLRRMAGEGFITLVEGAGGLRSPLGRGFDSADLIRALQARVILVGPNQLGVLNAVRLTLGALPEPRRRGAKVALMSPARSGRVQRGNLEWLREHLGHDAVFSLPFLRGWPACLDAPLHPRLARTLDGILKAHGVKSL
jgi:dethiobiotin synthetase